MKQNQQRSILKQSETLKEGSIPKILQERRVSESVKHMYRGTRPAIGKLDSKIDKFVGSHDLIKLDKGQQSQAVNRLHLGQSFHSIAARNPLASSRQQGSFRTRLPDLDPVVQPESFLHWRNLDRRGVSTQHHDRAQHVLINRAQNAIEEFERRVKKEEQRLREVRANDKRLDRIQKEKVHAVESKWQSVRSRQGTDTRTRLARSDKFYHKSIQDIRQRLKNNKTQDDERSLSHQSSIQKARDYRAHSLSKIQTTEEKRVRRAMEESHSRQSIHYERAHSAQSERLSNFRNSNSSWQRNYEGCVAKHADDQFNSLDRDYKRQLHQQKVENTKVKQLRTLASEQRQRLSKERQSFSSCLSQVSRDRADFVKKVKDNHKKLETFQKNKTQMIQQAVDSARDRNEKREQLNQQGQQRQLARLNSIKECVFRKQKQSLMRRRKQLKEVAPPNTWEIYTTNKRNREMHSSCMFFSPAVKQPKDQDEDAPKVSVPKIPINMQNPMLDMSLRLAMAHTAGVPYRVKQKKIVDRMPEKASCWS